MQSFPPTLILRHRRENLKKCSLRGLEIREDFIFFSYPCIQYPDFSGYLLLTLDETAVPISADDAESGVFLIDATWRYAEKIARQLPNKERLIVRSLPKHYRTAYPRKQEDCADPERGLASVEALYLSYLHLDRNVEGLLDRYYWKNEFLIKNGLVEK